MKVILFCPVRERAFILRETLPAHRQLEGISERWYMDDCDEPQSSALLKGEIVRTGPSSRIFGRATRQNAPAYQREGETHEWTGELCARVGGTRDVAIQMFLDSDADALFMLDSDLIPHPKTVTHLAGLNLPIVSEVFWSKWKENEPYLPNVWDFHIYGFKGVESILKLREPGVYRVGGLGAMTLMRRDALEKGVRYATVPGCECFAGEDRHFCIRAGVLGIPLHVDTHLPPFHIYRESQLQEAQTWVFARHDADYFRRVWLNRKWEKQVRTMYGEQS